MVLLTTWVAQMHCGALNRAQLVCMLGFYLGVCTLKGTENDAVSALQVLMTNKHNNSLRPHLINNRY